MKYIVWVVPVYLLFWFYSTTDWRLKRSHNDPVFLVSSTSSAYWFQGKEIIMHQMLEKLRDERFMSYYTSYSMFLCYTGILTGFILLLKVNKRWWKYFRKEVTLSLLLLYNKCDNKLLHINFIKLLYNRDYFLTYNNDGNYLYVQFKRVI